MLHRQLSSLINFARFEFSELNDFYTVQESNVNQTKRNETNEFLLFLCFLFQFVITEKNPSKIENLRG